MDHNPVRSVEMRECTTGYNTVAPIPTSALIAPAILITYAGIPFQSKVAVINVPKQLQDLEIFKIRSSIDFHMTQFDWNLSS
jgi:hypothetical protein